MTKATEVYRERLARYRALSKVQIRHHRLAGILFLVCFILGLIILSYIPRAGITPLATVPTMFVAIYLYILILFYLFSLQKRIEKLRRKYNRGIDYYERGLARLENRWAGCGITGEKYCDEAHPYAKDIDIFGKGSLFELLCNTRTRSGEEMLANWLLVPGTPNIIRARQEAVAELREKLDFREDIALLGEDITTVGSKAVKGLTVPLLSLTSTNSFNPRTAAEEVYSKAVPSALERWGTAPPELNPRLLRVIAFVLSLLPVTGVVLWISGFDPLWLFTFLFINGIFALSLRRRVVRVILAANQIGQELTLFSQVLKRIEREEFASSRSARLKEALAIEGAPPSRRIARLHSLIVGLDARRSLMFMPFAGMFLWATQFALAIEAWRLKSGALVKRWIEAVAEIEALSSIAGYAYEHANDPFPEIVENGLCFEAKSIGHPFIPKDRCIKNDIKLNNDIRLLVVSGSNTSGKSTLLRTVGTNAVLAFAGAPVRAQSLRISPMALGTSIRIQDSLQNGSSLFYAEIKRIRQLMGISDGLLPLLFIIEEILHGTNSHDRLIGAEAILTKLVEKGAVGLVTTHDLSLTNLTKKLGTRALNVYFECHLNNGQMEFDYILRQGIAGNSNAIELMRAVGIEV
jgi:MutS domain V